jgi:SAM-dependent methyltransferase
VLDRRLAFGHVAELYDRVRPSYPDAVIDDLIAFAGITPPSRLLDVGAGTGKLTRLLADRGFGVLGLEPSPAMAAVARRNCAHHASVEIELTDFERWRPRHAFPALVSAQAWHWIASDVRYARAGEALSSGGALAAIWTFPSWDGCRLRDPLREAYGSAAPGLAPDFPMHPASRPTALAGDWKADIEGSEFFAQPVVSRYPWTSAYSAQGYIELVGTHQDHILLEPPARAALFTAIGSAIDAGGGTIEMSWVTRLCVARRI